ncbi:4783_t:CDS:2 [Entrophospora sp. SA101]|nr:13561_t:CDS:2 [Entrophospora sp. SA101]CAJ0913455.1 4783_t:CDS:2 [Entrophospora sp. SA101]
MGNGNSTDVGDNYNLISTIRRNSKKPYTQQEFLFVDGRRFHNENDASYVLPNDDKEVDRLQMQHYLMKHVWGSNFSSPIETKLKQHGSREAGIGTLNQGPAQKLLMDAVKKLVNSNNLVFGVDIYQKNFENHPGLIDVKLEKRECLLGKSGGKLGEVCRDDFSTGCEALNEQLYLVGTTLDIH